MVISAVTVAEFSRWVRSNGLEVVMLLTGTVLLGRLARWTGATITELIDRRSQERDELVASEEAKHRHALTEAATWAVVAVTYCVAAVLLLQRFDIPLASLVAPATVAGVALGFGAQRVVQDLLGGFFVISERQFGYGDVIRVLEPGSTTGLTGTVEELTLRSTRLRTPDGEVLIVPNGDIRQVINLSRDWARAVIDVPVPMGSDIPEVSARLRTVGEEAFHDAQLGTLLLDPPSVMGVEDLAVDHLSMHVVARTLPGKQFEVARQLRTRIARALQEAGVNEVNEPTVSMEPGPA